MGTVHHRPDIAADSPRDLSRLVGLLLILPAVALIASLFVGPVITFLLRSFEGDASPFEQYTRLFGSDIYLRVLIRTLVISFLVTLTCLVLGYPVAWLLSRLRGWKLALLALFVLLPLWTSVLVRTYAWTVLLQRNGIVNSVLTGLGLTDAPLRLLYTDGAVVIAMAHVLLPFLILPLWGSLRQIPPEFRSAALVLGASEFSIFRRITAPLSAAGVGAGCLFVFLISLGFFVTPALVGGPRSMMIGTLVSQQALDALNWPFAAALSAVITAVVLMAMPFCRRLFLVTRAEG
ncbi:MAG: ABC transporter permease [Bosea sp.]|uniref:ABC transporter permease n=1 Tax=Bosea sp. (in: a-proteobacteria) TaxID=1871050 RepID=UPI001AD09BE7|nr:ABC transporter permease [Bosea sp. (in: a-proteobacteria)]MBN9451495.1 ABC transporter permease [Bosea sp. (in: a-proteobacteria)]